MQYLIAQKTEQYPDVIEWKKIGFTATRIKIIKHYPPHKQDDAYTALKMGAHLHVNGAIILGYVRKISVGGCGFIYTLTENGQCVPQVFMRNNRIFTVDPTAELNVLNISNDVGDIVLKIEYVDGAWRDTCTLQQTNMLAYAIIMGLADLEDHND